LGFAQTPLGSIQHSPDPWLYLRGLLLRRGRGKREGRGTGGEEREGEGDGKGEGMEGEGKGFAGPM